jgi:hypothetical protein
VLGQGLEATDSSRPEVRSADDRVVKAASALGNEAGLGASGVRARSEGLIAEPARDAGSAGSLTGAIGHSVKVTRSYWSGLFACDDAADLPRTNNDPEQFFGSYRSHERRASGRKVACPGTVVRGSVRLVASAASRLGPMGGADLVPSDLRGWRSLRRSLEARQAVRTLGRRFRRDPAAYLASLEESLSKGAVPP